MTKRQERARGIDVKALLQRDEGFLCAAVEALLKAVLEAEMSQAMRPTRAIARRPGWPTAKVIAVAR